MAAKMTRRTLLLVTLAVLVLILNAETYIAPGFATGPCHNLAAIGKNGNRRVVNLDELWSISSSLPFQVQDVPQGFDFQFAVCANSVWCNGAMAAACQTTAYNYTYSLGSVPSPISAVLLEDTPLGSVQLTTTMSYVNGVARTSTITIRCDPNAVEPTDFSVISAPFNQPPPYVYQFFLTHRSACGDVTTVPGACHKLEAKSSDGTSRIVNLDELSTLSSIAPFTAYDQGTGLRYSFGVCQNIPCTSSKVPAAGCVTTPAPYSFSLGPYPSQITANLTTSGYQNGAVQIYVPPFGYQAMLLTVVCDYNAQTPSNIFAISPKEGSPPPWHYQLFVTHRSACDVTSN